MRNDWFWIIGGSAVVIGAVAYEDGMLPRRISKPTVTNRTAPIWEYSYGVGTDANGVQYGVEQQEVKFQGLDSYGRDHEILAYRAVRSAGNAGGYLAIAGGTFDARGRDAEANTTGEGESNYQSRLAWASVQARNVAIAAKNSATARAQNPFPSDVELGLDVQDYPNEISVADFSPRPNQTIESIEIQDIEIRENNASSIAQIDEPMNLERVI